MATVTSNTRFVADHSAATPADANLVSADDIATYMMIDSVAVSTATSKAVSQINASNASSAPASTADSKAVSAGGAASTADSKAVSVSTSGVAATFAIVSGESGVTNTSYPVGDVRRYGAVCDGITNDSTAVQRAINSTGAILSNGGAAYPVYIPGPVACHGLSQTVNGQVFKGLGAYATRMIKNSNGSIIDCSGSDVVFDGVGLRGDAATPVYTGDNITFSGDRCVMINCGSQWAYGRAVKATGDSFTIRGMTGIFQTADSSVTGYDIEIGLAGGSGGLARLYHEISGVRTSQTTGGILLIDTGSTKITDCQFGKYTVQDSGGAGTPPSGANGGTLSGCRVTGNVLISLSNANGSDNQFGAGTWTLDTHTSGCVFAISNIWENGAVITNNGNVNNVIVQQVSTGTTAEKWQFGGSSSPCTMIFDATGNGVITLSAAALPNNKNLTFTSTSGGSASMSMSGSNNFQLTQANASGDIQIAVQSGRTILFYGVGGGKLSIGNGSSDQVGFYGTAPVSRQVLATGAGKTVDNVITALQNLGLVSQL